MKPEHAFRAFRGNALGCHTVAALNAFLPRYTLAEALIFEGLTGVPFGIAGNPEDPNRLIVPKVDPDLGLDAAFALLGAAPETRWFAPDEGGAALALLTRWLGLGPVLLGPLDMGQLKYLRNSNLYRGCDHYVAAFRLDNHGLWIVDGEGALPAVIAFESFERAWAAENLVEGRGAFAARRLRAGELPMANAGALLEGLRQACRLMRESADGPAVLFSLAEREADILSWPAGRRGLEFLLPTRCQRNLAALNLHARLSGLEKCRRSTQSLEAVQDRLLQQTLAIGRCMDGLLARRAGCLTSLREAARAEADLRDLYRELEDI